METKIKAAILALFFLLSLSLRGQKLTITPGVGVALPIGDFADDNPDNDNAEAATAGIQAALSVNFKPSNVVGVALNASYNSNALDNNSLARSLEDVTGSNWTVNEDKFEMVFVLLGPSIGYFSDQVEVSLQPGAGVGTIGYSIVQANNFIIPARSRYSAGNGTGFAFGATLDASLFFSESIGVSFALRYLRSTIERNYSTSFQIDNQTPEVELDVYDFKPSIIGATVGVAFRF